MPRGELERNTLDMLMQLPIGICCEKAEYDEGEEKNAFYCANEEFYRCIGCTPEEFLEKGNTLEKIVIRDRRRDMREKMRLAAECVGTSYSGMYEIMQRENKTCFMQWNVRCLMMGGDKILISCCMQFEELMHKQSVLIDRLNRETKEKKQLNDLIYELPVGVVVIKGGHMISVEVVNAEFLRSTGYTMAEMLDSHTSFMRRIYNADWGKFEEALESCRSSKRVEELELRMISKSGELHWKSLQCQLYYYRNAVPYYILTVWDINARKQLEDELHLMDEQYRMLEEVSEEFPFEYDVVKERFRVPQKYYEIGKITNRNKKYMDTVEMLGDIYTEDCDTYAEAICKAAEKEMAGTIDYRLNMAPEGRKPVYVWYRTVYRSIRSDNGKIKRIIGRSYDISYDRGIQEKLSEEMRLDPLTRLLNKVAVKEEVEDFLADNPEGTHVLFLIDIDNFKRVNDTFGHTVGDTVISDVAQVIGNTFGQTDIVGRIGGDEFLALMKNTTTKDASAKAEQLCCKAAKQLIGDEAELSVTLSIGMAVYQTDGEDYETLFDTADRAMYYTKRSGKNNYSYARKDASTGTGKEYEEQGAENGYLRSQEMDKEFLNFAFSILSHAKDVNGSLNVLIEQIGKRFGLDIVSVFEYSDSQWEMTLTNIWSIFRHPYKMEVLPCTIAEFKQAQIGEFVMITGESMKKQNRLFWENWRCGENHISHIAGVKFEISGKHTGCLYVGLSQKEDGFSEIEKGTICELSRIVAVFVSLRKTIRDDQREIQHLQNRDRLTGLYNLEAFRRRTMEVLKKIQTEAETEKPPVYALVHVDINNFSYVNENFGQKVGDDILKEFAAVLERREHVVEACRMYSDYFIELVVGESQEDVYQKISDINKRFEIIQKLKYPASSMHLSAGVCFIESGNEPFEIILEGANLARKQAKEQRSSVVIYQEGMRERRDDEIHITGRFYAAMQRGELELFLQPKFLLGEQKIYGAEALARWRLESGEVLSPAKFIPPLESMGYIVDLDFYILEQLLRAMKRWKEAGRKLFTISTNFSRRNFEDGGQEFINRLQNVMERYKIDPKYIEIEVTESVVADNLSDLKECLFRLKELGYRIAIDDFGTGYSSLSVLLEIPADVIKIDKHFTDCIDFEGQQDFVRHMGQFIKSAKEEVIFEGIEDQEQREFLMECGFRYGQGFLFDRPLTVAEFERKYI